MKKITILLVLIATTLFINNSINANDISKTLLLNDGIKITLKNNSLLPRKVTLISYKPSDNGSNGTNGFILLPTATKSFTFPIGTKLYLANSEQVNTVMSGKKITDEVPFLVVKAEDENKTFKIN